MAATPATAVLTNCFQDGWPAVHRVIRNRTVIEWEAAGCPLPGNRPGEGDVLATRGDGAKVLRYSIGVAKRDYSGRIVELPLWGERAPVLLRIFQRPENWYCGFGRNVRLRENRRLRVPGGLVGGKFEAARSLRGCQHRFPSSQQADDANSIEVALNPNV